VKVWRRRKCLGSISGSTLFIHTFNEICERNERRETLYSWDRAGQSLGFSWVEKTLKAAGVEAELWGEKEERK
jgi:hypothetical protein